MAFAGLWESWKDPNQSVPLETFSIITTDPNELMEPIHTRMPVIVPRADWSRWLGPVDPAQPATDLLRPHSSDDDDCVEGKEGCWERSERWARAARTVRALRRFDRVTVWLSCLK
jgi:putative SOS response-associated peptidase YedK